MSFKKKVFFAVVLQACAMLNEREKSDISLALAKETTQSKRKNKQREVVDDTPKYENKKRKTGKRKRGRWK